MRKKIIAQKFVNGIEVRAAGNTINVSAGPDKGISYKGIPEIRLMFPI